MSDSGKGAGRGRTSYRGSVHVRGWRRNPSRNFNSNSYKSREVKNAPHGHQKPNK